MSNLTYSQNASRSNAAGPPRSWRPLIWDAEHIPSPFGASAQVEAAILLRRLQRHEHIPGFRVRPAVSLGPRCYMLRVPRGGPTDLCGVVYRDEEDAIVILGVHTHRRNIHFMPQAFLNTCCGRQRRYLNAADVLRNGLRPPDNMSEFLSQHPRRRLLKGWVSGDGCDFIGVSPDVVRFIELRIGFSSKVRNPRLGKNISQRELADRLGSSQSRVAKLETGDLSVSFELLMRALVIVGATDSDIAQAVFDSPDSCIHKGLYRRTHKPRAARITSTGAGFFHHLSNAAAP